MPIRSLIDPAKMFLQKHPFLKWQSSGSSRSTSGVLSRSSVQNPTQNGSLRRLLEETRQRLHTLGVNCGDLLLGERRRLLRALRLTAAARGPTPSSRRRANEAADECRGVVERCSVPLRGFVHGRRVRGGGGWHLASLAGPSYCRPGCGCCRSSGHQLPRLRCTVRAYCCWAGPNGDPDARGKRGKGKGKGCFETVVIRSRVITRRRGELVFPT